MPSAVGEEINPLTLEFLEQLYGSFTDGWLTLFSLDRPQAERGVHWAPVDHLGELAATATALQGRCVWFGVATRRRRLPDGRRGGAEDCIALPGLWADIDVAGPNHATEGLPATMEEAWALLQRFPVPPTAVVATGGGLQPWWLFSEPLAVDEGTRALLARWGATWASLAAVDGLHIDNVFDLARIMRLPGTLNTKGTPAVVVNVFHADWSRRYGVDDLDQWLEDPPPPPASRSVDRVPYIGPERPGDAFNARHSGEEVLASLGFEAHRRRQADGSLHFTWPGASGDVGATAYPDGHVTIWSETFTSTHRAVAVRRPYDPFGLLVAARHGGDFSAATEELKRSGYGTDHDAAVEAWMASLPAMALTSTNSNQAAADLLEHSWQPLDVGEVLAAGYAPPVPTLFTRADGQGLLYPGRVNAFHGESGSGKSWMAMAACAEVLRAGGRVLYVDLEDHIASVVARFRALGVADDFIADDLDYISPAGPYTVPAQAAVQALVAERCHALVVIDSVGEGMAIDGAKQNDDDAVAQWMRRLPRALAGLGPAVVLIDHIPKADDAPKLFAIGSQRKRAAIDGVAYRVEARSHPAKGRTGYLALIVAKDRNGYFQAGAKAADVTVWSAEDGNQVEITLRSPEANQRPTVLMEKLSRYLEGGGAQTGRQLEAGVQGKTDAKRRAIELLVEEGFVGRHPKGQAVYHHSIKPFRRDEDDMAWIEGGGGPE